MTSGNDEKYDQSSLKKYPTPCDYKGRDTRPCVSQTNISTGIETHAVCLYKIHKIKHATEDHPVRLRLPPLQRRGIIWDWDLLYRIVLYCIIVL